MSNSKRDCRVSALHFFVSNRYHQSLSGLKLIQVSAFFSSLFQDWPLFHCWKASRGLILLPNMQTSESDHLNICSLCWYKSRVPTSVVHTETCRRRRLSRILTLVELSVELVTRNKIRRCFLSGFQVTLPKYRPQLVTINETWQQDTGAKTDSYVLVGCGNHIDTTLTVACIRTPRMPQRLCQRPNETTLHTQLRGANSLYTCAQPWGTWCTRYSMLFLGVASSANMSGGRFFSSFSSSISNPSSSLKQHYVVCISTVSMISG